MSPQTFYLCCFESVLIISSFVLFWRAFRLFNLLQIAIKQCIFFPDQLDFSYNKRIVMSFYITILSCSFCNMIFSVIPISIIDLLSNA